MEAKDEDIEHDIQTQIDRWRKTCAAIKKKHAPAQLMSEMNRANTIIRDSLNGSFSQIAVDDEAMYNDIRNYIRLIEPEKEKIVKLYRGNVPIFDNFDISKQIKSLFAKYVSLRRGAYLIIEHTEAMNVIDVNSGNRTKGRGRSGADCFRCQSGRCARNRPAAASARFGRYRHHRLYRYAQGCEPSVAL